MTDDRNKRLRELRATQKRDRNRIIFLAVTLAMVLVAYFQVGNNSNRNTTSNNADAKLQSVISLPPIQDEEMSKVMDGTEMERRILEPEPFRHLAQMSQALHSGHLRSLKEPSPQVVQLTNTPSGFRGKPYRIRGELLNIDITTRTPGAPKEFWCRIRLDDNTDVLFASMQVPEELFGSENYVRADGFFFKNYTWSHQGEKFTAPLFVGREVVPSARKIEEVTELDLMFLNKVRDQRAGVTEELDQSAMWHLLSHAKWLQANPDELQQTFADAPEMDFDLLAQLAAEPELFRGKAIQVPGRVPDNNTYRWGEIAGENPLRATWLRYGYLGNLSFSDHPILLVGSDAMDFSGDRARWYYGHFMQLKGYTDRKDIPRRAPVFIVSGFREADRSTPNIVGEMVWWFIGIGLSVAAFMFWAAARDKKSAMLADEARRKRRSQRRTVATTDQGDKTL